MDPLRSWVCVALLFSLATATVVGAQSPPMVSHLEAAGVLVMPFDVTTGKASYQIVSNVGRTFGDAVVRTHWVYYAADCRHLANVTIDLTDNDTVVVDPTRVQNQTQAVNARENTSFGGITDLSGERGIVVVSASAPDGGPDDQIAGAWTIADLASSSSFGSDALGFSSDGSLPLHTLTEFARLSIPTFNPSTLEASQVIVMAIASDGGIAPFGGEVCCDVLFTDTLEFSFSLPDYCFTCAGFTPIAAGLGPADDNSLLPPSLTAASAGFVRLDNCRTAAGDLEPPEVAIFAFHGQSVGAFGFALAGKYRRLTL